MRNARRSHLVVLLGSTSMAALGFGQSRPVVAQATDTTGCPVVVSAKYVPDASVRPVGPAGSGESRQPLHISFGFLAAGDELKVQHAQVTVRGITEKGGVIPAGAAPGSPWLQKKFTLDVATNAAGLLSSTIWLTGFGGVSDVRVDSMTYSNGTVWTAPAAKSCHASMGAILTLSK